MSTLETIANKEFRYFTYDPSRTAFIKSAHTHHPYQSPCYNELIKLTFELSKSNIMFYIDKDSNIVIGKAPRILDAIISRCKKSLKVMKQTLTMKYH